MEGGPVELTEADDGTTVRVPMGAPVVVALPEVRTAGFKWSVADDLEGVLILEADDHQPGGRAGGEGAHLFRLRAARPGRTTLRLAYRRPWEPAGAAGRDWHVVVEVAPTG